MRRFAPLVPRRESLIRLLAGTALAVVAAFSTMQAQIPGRNVNMVSGTGLWDGDPFLQRQNEPSIAASTRNPLHLLAGSNDYRTVDLPFPADGDNETGDAWLGLFKSVDGGQRWTSGLLPGYPQDDSAAGKASPLSKKYNGGYQAGADAVVRAGTNGLLYLSGLAFDRGEGGKSGIFLSRFIDNNNREAGDPVAYLGTVMIAKSTPGRFLDKPWMAVDIPRADSPTCTITAANTIETSRRSTPGWGRGGRQGRRRPVTPPGAQRIRAGAVYVAYTSFTGADDTLRSEIYMTRSVDCGATWSTPFLVSGVSDPLNQGATITIDPRDGSVFVAWRRFANAANPDKDGIMVAKLPYGGKRLDAPGRAHQFPLRNGQRASQQLHRIFEHGRVKARPSELADISEFDQGSSSYSFRTNAYPTTATDGSGRVYVAWTQRGFPTGDTTAPDAGARIMMVTTRDGSNFTPASAVDDSGQLGHQLMPSLAFGGGKLMLVYYDLRETRANRHSTFVTDQQGVFNNTGIRQTIDIRAAMAAPGDYPDFGDGLVKSVKVSDYLMGVNSKTSQVQALQVNPPNLPMFRQGTTPFMGDYIDVAVAPAFVLNANGRWAYNTGTSNGTPVFHAAWTDNRDVRPPFRDVNGDGNPWNDYTPANMSRSAPARVSLSSPPGITIPVPACEDGNAGSRNQNVYSARITGGLLAGSPGNAKPLGYATYGGVQKLIQRGFVVFAQNATAETRRFRMSIRSQPVGGRASFEQFGLAQLPLTSLEMNVPPRSTASRTVYATSTDANASITVDVTETTPPDLNGVPVSLGLSSVIVLNPDIENPDIENPNIANPDIANTEVYNPDIENPDIENPDIENVRVANPDIENPDIENPDIENPDIENVRVANPDIENLTITNPDIENPDIENPDIENPDIENPDIENGAVADVTWKVSNTGNTTAAFNVNIFLAQQNLPQGVSAQLILFKTYRTPVTAPNGCQLAYQTRNVLMASILNPTFIQPNSGGPPDQNDPSEKNASMWLAPGEEGRITLRVIHDDLPQNLVTVTNADGTTKLVYIDPAFAPTTSATPTVSSQGVGTIQAAAGQTDPPLVTPTGSNLFFLQMPTNTAAGSVIAPTVSVQVRDNFTGRPVVGATVVLSLGSPALDAFLTGNVSVSQPITGIANFPTLSVAAPGIGYTLSAVATAGGGTTAAASTSFDIRPPTIVLNTNDSGFGSLRAAMLWANATPGMHTITFDIPQVTAASPAVIAVQTPLPTISSPMIVDARTQPGYDNRPVVELTWAGANPAANGFTINFDQANVQILGLAITNFPSFGIQSLQADSPGGGGHQIRFNAIGTDRFSAGGKGNGIGLEMRTDDALIEANVISGNAGAGLLVNNDADRVRITGNRIGTNFEGLLALPNDSGIRMFDSLNDIDILSNLIAGNAEYGIDIQASEGGNVTNTRIRGNRIGVSDNGSALGNGDGGVRISNAPGTTIGELGPGVNTISANGGAGIAVSGAASTGVVIQGNQIGLDPTGGASRANVGPGILINASGVAVGGTAPNAIAFNGGSGVVVASGTGNQIVNNSIRDNSLLGIDLGGDGVTLNDTNDADTGPNGFQNFPVLSNARNGGPATLVDFQTGTFAAGNYTLRFFASTCDANGHGEGARQVGLVGPIVNGTNGAIQLTELVPAGQAITATATDQAGNTSEFSACVVVAIPPTGNIAAVSPASPSAFQMVTFQGSGLPLFGGNPFTRPRAFFTQGANTAEGFVFFGDSNQWWVRLPAGLASGAATVYAATWEGVTASGPFGLTISAVPAAPIITAILPLNAPPGPSNVCGGGYASLTPTGTATPGQGIGVVAYGTDTSGAIVVFTQGENVFEVAATCATSSLPPGLGVTVTVPLGLAQGPVNVSVKQQIGASVSALSAPVPMTVPGLPPMATFFVPGQAGGTANTNLASAGGIDPVSAGYVADGQIVQFAATGDVTWYASPDTAGPDGVVMDTDDTFLAPALPAIALVARIGAGPWQLVGSGPTQLGGAGQSGTLQFAVNDSTYGDLPLTDGDDSNGGGFSVTVTPVVRWAGNNRFYAFIPTHTSAPAAEGACVQAGGHLASVLSLDENEFIGSLIGPANAGFPTAFIGGVQIDGVWQWTDTNGFDYTNWRSGEPTGDGSSIQLWPSNSAFPGWNDVPNNIILEDGGYVCKFVGPSA